MNKNKYINTIKTLISSNLLFFKTSTKTKSFFNLNYLDPLQFIKNLKQLIRILQFLKNQINPRLYLQSDNFLFDEILSSILFENRKTNIYFMDVFLKTSTKENKLSRSKKKTSLFLYLNKSTFTPNYFRLLFQKGFILNQSINTNFSRNSLGFYKCYADINDLKTNFFFILLLKKNL